MKTVEQHIFLGSGSGSVTVVPVFNMTVCVSAEMEIKLLFFFARWVQMDGDSDTWGGGAAAWRDDITAINF